MTQIRHIITRWGKAQTTVHFNIVTVQGVVFTGSEYTGLLQVIDNFYNGWDWAVLIAISSCTYGLDAVVVSNSNSRTRDLRW